jgi:hypothetical protein
MTFFISSYGFSEASQLAARGSLAVGSEMELAIEIAADLVANAHGMRNWVPDLAGADLYSLTCLSSGSTGFSRRRSTKKLASELGA